MTAQNAELKSALKDSSAQVTAFSGKTASESAKINSALKNAPKGVGAAFKSEMTSITASFSHAGESASGFLKKMVLLGIGFAGLKFSWDKVSEGFKSANEAEQAEKRLEILTGSAEEAEKRLSALKEFSKQSAFGFGMLEEASIGLTSIGVRADQIIPTLRTLGDLSLANQERFNAMLEVYTKGYAARQLSARELTAFASQGIPIYEALGQVMGVATEEVKALAKEGEIGFGDFQKALNNLTGSGGRFDNALERMTETTTGRLDKMSRAAKGLFKSFAEQFKEHFDAKGLIDEITSKITWIKTNVVPSLAEAFATGAQKALEAWKAVKEWFTEGVGNELTRIVAGLGKTFVELVKGIGDALTLLKPILKDVADFCEDLSVHIKQIGLGIARFWLDTFTIVDQLKEMPGDMWAQIKAVFGAMGQGAEAEFKAAADAMKKEKGGVLQDLKDLNAAQMMELTREQANRRAKRLGLDKDDSGAKPPAEKSAPAAAQPNLNSVAAYATPLKDLLAKFAQGKEQAQAASSKKIAEQEAYIANLRRDMFNAQRLHNPGDKEMYAKELARAKEDLQRMKLDDPKARIGAQEQIVASWQESLDSAIKRKDLEQQGMSALGLRLAKEQLEWMKQGKDGFSALVDPLTTVTKLFTTLGKATNVGEMFNALFGKDGKPQIDPMKERPPGKDAKDKVAKEKPFQPMVEAGSLEAYKVWANSVGAKDSPENIAKEQLRQLKLIEDHLKNKKVARIGG